MDVDDRKSGAAPLISLVLDKIMVWETLIESDVLWKTL